MKPVFAVIALVTLAVAYSQTAQSAEPASAASTIDAPTIAAGCAAPSCANQLAITHLRVGLVCPQGRSGGGGWICFETTTVPITGQSGCVYAGNPHPCTWYGFEFEYTNARPGDDILCVVTSDRSASYGDPAGVQQQHTTRFEYRLRLESQAGRFYNPQYSVFEAQGARDDAMTETVCSSGGRELFRFPMHLQFPH